MSTWIPVLVRVEDLADITAYVAELEQRRGEQPHVPIGEAEIDAVEVHDDHLPTEEHGSANAASLETDWPAWPLEDLRRLALGSTATTERWAKAMDVCAERPGQKLPTTEVADRSEMSVSQWRDATRKISRHLKAHYSSVPRDPAGHLAWPLRATGNPDFPGQVSWVITDEQARRWTAVRDEQHP